jgi:hypothetical protein
MKTLSFIEAVNIGEELKKYYSTIWQGAIEQVALV